MFMMTLVSVVHVKVTMPFAIMLASELLLELEYDDEIGCDDVDHLNEQEVEMQILSKNNSRI